MSKKILYIKAQGLGDMIGGIPFLAEQKKLGHEVYQTFYDMRHVNRGVEKLTKEQQQQYKKYPMYGGWHHILQMIKDQGLVKEIIIIPYGYRNMFCFLIKNFKQYDEVIIPIKTKAAQFLGWIMGNKTHILFENTNDTSNYRILADGEHGGICPPLYRYHNDLTFPTEKLDLPDSFITIFPSIYERSLEIQEWIDIINFIRNKGYQIIIVGGEREQWFTEELKKHHSYDKVIDYMSKTTFGQMVTILQHASLCISGNGGPMRIANLVNAQCINIHTTSAFLMEPPTDNVNSFNIRPYEYKECKPCECADSTIGLTGISGCIFYKTKREGECRKVIKSVLIIGHIKRIFKI